MAFGAFALGHRGVGLRHLQLLIEAEVTFEADCFQIAFDKRTLSALVGCMAFQTVPFLGREMRHRFGGFFRNIIMATHAQFFNRLRKGGLSPFFRSSGVAEGAVPLGIRFMDIWPDSIFLFCAVGVMAGGTGLFLHCIQVMWFFGNNLVAGVTGVAKVVAGLCQQPAKVR
ncbi:MAG: hypothetical protein NDI77_03560 [Geobacteraceae bacterium]|nr:hypothetical protein [Geobacteraceae bacterium]